MMSASALQAIVTGVVVIGSIAAAALLIGAVVIAIWVKISR